MEILGFLIVLFVVVIAEEASSVAALPAPVKSPGPLSQSPARSRRVDR